MKYFYPLLFLVMTGCETDTPCTVKRCSVDSAERRAAFILKCAEAANPFSDEEGEDLVRECALQAEMFCADVPGYRETNGNCRSCTGSEEPAACRARHAQDAP